MALTLLPSILGAKSVFGLMLNAKALTFIARISFCTYLVHLIILYGFVLERTYDVYYDIIDNFVLYNGILVLSLACGFIMTLFIELPFANLLKLMLKKVQKEKSKEKMLLKEEQKGQKRLI